MEAGNLLELALAAALAQCSAEAGDGNGDEQSEGDSPETGKPEDPGMTLGRRAAEASEDESTYKRKSQRDHEGWRDGAGVIESGHSSIRGSWECASLMNKQGFGLSIGECPRVPTAKSTPNQANNPTLVLARNR
jgi:hypothetical protein